MERRTYNSADGLPESQPSSTRMHSVIGEEKIMPGPELDPVIIAIAKIYLEDGNGEGR
ncbi:MAG: hypothetical protein JO026_00265 [Patescibacteria group bacterium]|nr:hypothetical protein [Patescibacteria group bacterium]